MDLEANSPSVRVFGSHLRGMTTTLETTMLYGNPMPTNILKNVILYSESHPRTLQKASSAWRERPRQEKECVDWHILSAHISRARNQEEMEALLPVVSRPSWSYFIGPRLNHMFERSSKLLLRIPKWLKGLGINESLCVNGCWANRPYPVLGRHLSLKSLISFLFTSF